MPKHINITISGRVQGVGFRRAARDQARYMGIKGYVKNLSDGSVFVEAEGDDPNLALFIQWCRQGSSYSQVEEVTVEHKSWIGFSTFETLY
jgi:acylphosphatase